MSALLASGKGLQDSPYHDRHTPLARSQAEKEALETAFPGLKGRVLVASAGDVPSTPVAAARVAGGMDTASARGVRDGSSMVPESPGDILVRNLDTGEELPAKQVLSRLSLHDKMSAKPSSMLSQLRGLGPQLLRVHGLLRFRPCVSMRAAGCERAMPNSTLALTRPPGHAR